MKKISEEEQKRIEVLSLFGIIPFVPESMEEHKENIIFNNFWGALYWGRNKKAFQKKWATEGEDAIPNTINCFMFRKNLFETGTGCDPNEAYEDAVRRMNLRRIKRGAEIMMITSGRYLKNGRVFYYTLGAQIMKIKNIENPSH